MSPLVLLLGSLTYSLAFNVAWAWGSSPLSVGAAAACTLIVPAGLHLWNQVPANTKLVELVRALVMTGICLAASITSFQHAVAVLLDNHWTDLAAWSVTGGAELLTALSTMALRSPAQPVKKPAAKTVEKAKPQPKVVEKPTPVQASAPEPDVPSLEQPRNRRAAGLQFARDRWPNVTGGQIAAEVDVSKAEADRIRAMVKREKEAVS